MHNKKNTINKHSLKNLFQTNSTNKTILNSLNEKNSVYLSKQEEYFFEKYANKYNIDKGSTKERTDSIQRERYLYYMLNRIGVENTGVEQLLNLTIEDIQHQYSIKNAIESKAGFVIALWGVLVGIVLQKELYVALILRVMDLNLNFLYRIFNLLIFVGLLTSGAVTLFLIAQTLIKGEYSRYNFDNKELNFKCAVEDKNMLLTKLLDSNTTVWIKNEATNQKKYVKLKLSIICTAVFIIFILISFSIQ